MSGLSSRTGSGHARSGWGAGLQNAAQIAATFAFMALLWSMWSADSLTEWFYFLRSGNI